MSKYFQTLTTTNGPVIRQQPNSAWSTNYRPQLKHSEQPNETPAEAPSSKRAKHHPPTRIVPHSNIENTDKKRKRSKKETYVAKTRRIMPWELVDFSLQQFVIKEEHYWLSEASDTVLSFRVSLIDHHIVQDIVGTLRGVLSWKNVFIVHHGARSFVIRRNQILFGDRALLSLSGECFYWADGTVYNEQFVKVFDFDRHLASLTFAS